MNPLRLQLQGYRCFDRLDLDLPDGALAIVGENGAGKSSIIDAVDVALFGPRGRSWGPLVAEGGDGELQIELTFDHDGGTYRVRRGYSSRGKGKATLDLEVEGADGSWMPLTRGSIGETQEWVEELLGLERRTFRASSFLAQADGAAFTEADPRDRKAILADVLGLDRWDRLHTRATNDLRDVEAVRLRAAGQAGALEDRVRGKDRIAARLAEAEAKVAEVEAGLAVDRAALDAARARVRDLAAAGERHGSARRELENATARMRDVGEMRATATSASELIVELERNLVDLATEEIVGDLDADEREVRDEIAERERAIAEHDRRAADRDSQLATKRSAREAAGRAAELADGLRTKANDVLDRMEEGEDGTCDYCGQTLGRDAAEKLAAKYRSDAAELDTQARELNSQADAVEVVEVGDRPEVDGVLVAAYQALEARLRQAREEVSRRVATEERLRALRARVEEVESETFRERERAASEALRAAEERLEASPPADQDAAREAADDVARLERKVEGGEADERLHRDDLVEYRTHLAGIAEAETALAGQKEVERVAEEEAELLRTLVRAYGRDGIPALIVENTAVPYVEAEAGRILDRLGSPFRVELRTQRATASGELRDALDVVVLTEAGERPYETFSGGERTRVNLALRIALASLLAGRRGADSRLLAIDEPEFLDEAGTAALADVLVDLWAEGRFDRVWLVSHVPSLRDAFGRALVVRREGDRSVVSES